MSQSYVHVDYSLFSHKGSKNNKKHEACWKTVYDPRGIYDTSKLPSINYVLCEDVTENFGQELDFDYTVFFNLSNLIHRGGD